MDRVGALSVPIPPPPPIATEALVDKPQAVGDPALVILADFVATVLNHDCQAAWETLVPTTHRGIMRGPREVPGVGRGTVVREVHFMNPVPLNPTGVNTRFINESNLPALYVYREFRTGRRENYTSDANRRTSTIKIEWVGPCTGDQVDAIVRAAFHNAIASTVEKAIRFGRHRAWVIADDEADPKALAMTTTQTSNWVLSGNLLNGLGASKAIFPARPILITTPPQTSASYPLQPIQIYGLNGSHRSWMDTITLTNALGGESVGSIWPFEKVTRIELPGAPVAGAPLHIGYALSPDQREGSLVARHAGFSRMQVIQPGDLRAVPTGQTGEGKDGPVMGAALGLEMSIQVEEDIVVDPLMHAAMWHTYNAIENRIVHNGQTWSIDYFQFQQTP